jgi:hypothetical protein
MRSHIHLLRVVGALGLGAMGSASAQDVLSDSPHCTVTAYPPSGTASKMVFGGSYQCDRPVRHFRLMVSLNSHYTNNDMDYWSDGYGESQDFTQGEGGGYFQFEGALTPPIELRTHVHAFSIDDDGAKIADLGDAYSGSVELR